MVTTSRYLMNGSPVRCTFCHEPFRCRDGHVEAWRTSSGQYFCSEFCADDAEEAQFQKKRRSLEPVRTLRISR
jgi:hypothetical protein